MPAAPAARNCRWRPPSPRRFRRSTATPSRASAIPTAASARGIFSASPPPSSASRPPWTTPSAAFAPNSCRVSRTWTTSSPSPTTYGCGVAIDAPGAAVPIRTLKHISLHANLGARAPDRQSRLRKTAARAPVSATSCRVLDEPTSFACRISAASPKLSRPSCEPPKSGWRNWTAGSAQTCPASDLVVGLQCGGSDAFSGVTCNPAVGYAADLLVRAGATVMFSEVTEVRDAMHLLTPRAVNAGGRAAP